MNRFVWDLHYPDATGFPNLIMWGRFHARPDIVPGTYTVRLTVDGKSQTQTFGIVKDPRLGTTKEDFDKQLALALQIRDKLSQTNQAVVDIREAKKQLAEYAARLKDDASQKKVVDAANDLIKAHVRGGRRAVPGEKPIVAGPLEFSDQAEQPHRGATGRGHGNRHVADEAIVYGV